MSPCLLVSMHRFSFSYALLGAVCMLALAVHGQETTAEGKPSVDEAKQQDNESDQELTPEQIEEMMREPPSHLADMPGLDIDTSKYKATPEQRDQIATLIDQLAEIDKPDYGMAPWMSGCQFAPIKSSQQFAAGIIMVDHGLETSDALEQLVAFGPKALPALIKALDDATPTKHKMEHGGGMGMMWYGSEVAINRANPRESNVRDAHADFFNRGAGLGSDHISKHTITRGDVCFLILGQIVNRSYQAARYQPTACLVINSPTHDPEIAKIVREVWESSDPAATLFESLMKDFHSRGGAAAYQIGAAMRLLYYFLDESRDLIVKRLDGFDVHNIRGETDWDEAWMKQMEANGDARPDEFIKAVAFSEDTAITSAILRILQRTDAPNVVHECLTHATVEANPELVFKRMGEMIAVAPPPGQGPFGGEFYILKAAARLFPEKARPLFDSYLEHDTLETRRAAIHALKKTEAPVPWAIDFLTPLLDDQADTGWEYGPDYDRKPIRVCDEAAEALTFHVTGATFKLEGEAENLDRQIANIHRRIAGQPVLEDQVGKLQIDFDTVMRREPLASFTSADSLGQIYGFSDSPADQSNQAR